jgi:hypothetical protein
MQQFHRLFNPIQADGQVIAFESENVDRFKLEQFLISVLWRASVSKQDYFGRIDLEDLTDEAAKVILSPSDLIPSFFNCVILRWGEREGFEGGLQLNQNPQRARWRMVRGYRFYLGETIVWIRARS